MATIPGFRSARCSPAHAVIGLAACLVAFTTAAAQTNFPTRFSPGLPQQPAVATALQYAVAHHPDQVSEWIRMTEIPAPSKAEKQRAMYVREQWVKAGLSDVQMDEMGNCWGTVKGSVAGPALVIAAHTDTVFPAETPLKVREEKGRLHAPGILDDTAGCAALLAACRALQASKVKLRSDVIFLATVQEEIGLNGMRHWLRGHEDRAGLVVALDGAIGNVRYGALGIRWLKFIYAAEGAHTLNSRGKPNPARSVSQAIQGVYTIPLAESGSEQSGIYNVGMIGGGEVVNGIPREAWFTADIRSNNPFVFNSLINQITQFAEDAAQAHHTTLRVETLTDQPPAGTAKQLESRRAHFIVQTALDIQKHLDTNHGRPVEAIPSGSTDANIGIELGIPAIAVGTAHGTGTHTLKEWAERESSLLGTKNIILLAVALAGLAE